MMRVVDAYATGITPVVVSRADGTIRGNNGDTGFVVPICAACSRRGRGPMNLGSRKEKCKIWCVIR